VRKTWKPTSVAALALLAVLAAGCGGGGGSAASTSTAATTTAAAPTTTAAAGGTQARFTAEQWSKYQADAASFQSVNEAAIQRASICAKKINPPAGYLQKCVGNELTKLMTATNQLSADLRGFVVTVHGACLDALNGLLNYVVPYKASVQALQQAIDANNAAASYSVSSSIKTARAGGKAQNAKVVKACAPLS
jgi:hypothetical protein